MSARANTDKVTVTIDGTKYSIPPGQHSIKDIIAYTGINGKTASLTVSQAAPSQGSSVPGNGSYNFIGGEVLTSALGV